MLSPAITTALNKCQSTAGHAEIHGSTVTHKHMRSDIGLTCR